MSNEMLELFLREKSRGGPYAGLPGAARTIDAYRVALRLAQQRLGKSLLAFTKRDAEELVYAMRHLAPSTQNQNLAALRNFFRWAIDSGRYHGDYPFSAVVPRRRQHHLPYILSRAQLDAFLDALPSRKYRMLFSLMYFGGLRIGEAVTARIDDLTENGLLIRGKGDRMRHVPLPASMLANLRDYIAGDVTNETEFIFVSDRLQTPMYPKLVYKRFEAAKAAAGLPAHVRVHNLRHTSATHFHQATGDLAATQRFLGHASPTTTMIYAQIADQTLQEGSRKAFGD